MATLYGIGVGPGDAELLTLKAARLIGCSDLLCFLSNDNGSSMAKRIAQPLIDDKTNAAQQELAIAMPMSEDRRAANIAYDNAAKVIAQHLDNDKDVVFLCEGDPLFFGSFAYVMQRLQDSHRIEVVPGITSISAASAALQRPLAMLSDNIAIISGRHDGAKISGALAEYDNLVIMKPGRRRAELIALISAAGRAADTSYIEYVGHPKQRIVSDISTLGDDNGPYFSLFLIHRNTAERGE